LVIRQQLVELSH